MDVFLSAIKMLGGLALLIYGMKLLSTQLKKLSGGKLEQTLINVTDNPYKGLFFGFLITVATQSSATTTVIVVSLVNSGILQLRNSIPIIMGANIGTTINSQILRLTAVSGNSFLSIISPANLAPIILIIGLIIMERAKKQKVRDVGQMIMGLGILFTGMITMVSMASTFSSLPILPKILQKLSNPILGVVSGAIVTAIVQSSAATIGILQALSTTGIITYSTTIPIILGQNIGTCITSILASMSGSKNAKRVAAVHLYFNLIGTILFLAIIYLYQNLVGFSFWNNAVDMGGIANFHTIFNVLSTLVLFPFIPQLEKLTKITVREKKTEENEVEDTYLAELNKLDERITLVPGIAIINSVKVIEIMGEIASKNFKKTKEMLFDANSNEQERIQEREDIIDKMEERVTKYLVDIGALTLSDDENQAVTLLMKVESEFEKIGDYSYRISKNIEHMHDKEIKLSKKAIEEVNLMYMITMQTIDKTVKLFKSKNEDYIVEIAALKEIADVKNENYRQDHIDRLKKGTCNVESGIIFLEFLTVFEKIFDHCLHVSMELSNFLKKENIMTKQGYYKRIYEENTKLLKDKLNEYSLMYDI